MRESRLAAAHLGNAARAALTAASTVAADAALPCQTTACVTGFRDENCGPSLASQRPPIQCSFIFFLQQLRN